jgi:uridine kinase
MMVKAIEKTIIIGIGGGSGSGKTTLLRRLGEVFGNQEPAIFSMDNYYNPIDAQQKDSKGIVNFDLPSALNEEQLTKDLISLSKGNSIEVKEYYFNSNPNKNVLLTIQPSRIIIVEGLFLFHYAGVKQLLDYTIFVDVEQETQLDRRIYRDQETRGYSRSAIIYQWENHALPCYENYIYPYKNKADFIFRNDHRADEDFQELMKSIQLALSNIATP